MELVDNFGKKSKTLKDKIDLFSDLKPEEVQKLISRFQPSLGLVTYDELKTMIDYLREIGVKITMARNVSDTVNEISKVRGGIAILEDYDVDALKMYEKNPRNISKSAFDIGKRIKYCQMHNINYMTEDGAYKSFVFNETEFNEEAEKNKKITPLENQYTFEETPKSLDADSFKNSLAFELNDEAEDFNQLQDQIQLVRGLRNPSSVPLNDNGADIISFDEFEPEMFDLEGNGRGRAA